MLLLLSDCSQLVTMLLRRMEEGRPRVEAGAGFCWEGAASPAASLTLLGCFLTVEVPRVSRFLLEEAGGAALPPCARMQ
jgi:hypothetical protein